MSATFKSRLGKRLAAFIALMQALGRRFFSESYTLANLDRFLAKHQLAALTATTFARWTKTFLHASPTTRRARMLIVRKFCIYLRRTNPTCFVPDLRGFPARLPHRRPHIFAPHQIAALIGAATTLPARPTSLLRGPVFRLAIVLLYTVGLRRGELLRLTISDYDAEERTLLIRASKFHKSRVVALSPTAVVEVTRYLGARRRFSHPADAPLLINNHGRRAHGYTGEGFAFTMRSLFRESGIRNAEGQLPRVHDLRHTYAVHALLRWYRAGANVQAKLPILSTAMGHVSIASTAHYLSFLEPLAVAASTRFERHCRRLFKTGGRKR
jgi:integrase/recombinase XerD